MRKKNCFGLLALLMLLTAMLVHDQLNAVQVVRDPYYDLTALAEKESLNRHDYEVLFRQTGLGPMAINDLKLCAPDLSHMLRLFQNQMREPVYYKSEFIYFPTTKADLLKNDENRSRHLLLPPLKKGDILITKSTHTLLYRHGHAGLVLDPEAGEVVESQMIGTLSDIMDLDIWTDFATLMILRPKTDDQHIIDQAVEFARSKLINVPYNLLTGILRKDKSAREQMDSTHCAHLVWLAYYQAGLNLDSDAGWLVTPRDIANSPELEVVFSFGFGDEAKW